MNTGVLLGLAVLAYYFFSQKGTSAGGGTWTLGGNGVIVQGASPNSTASITMSVSGGTSVSANLGTTDASGNGSFSVPVGFGQGSSAPAGSIVTLSVSVGGKVIGTPLSQTVPASNSAGTTGTGVTVPTQTTQPGNVSTQISPVLPNTYAAFKQAIQSAVGTDPAVTSAGADQFVLAYYLQNVAAPALKNVALPLGSIFPGSDPAAVMTPSAFWTGVASWLSQNNTYGLSGVGAGRQWHA